MAAEKMAQRLAERAEGTITAEDAVGAKTIEELATVVRNQPEDGMVDGFAHWWCRKRVQPLCPVCLPSCRGVDGGLRATGSRSVRRHPGTASNGSSGSIGNAAELRPKLAGGRTVSVPARRLAARRGAGFHAQRSAQAARRRCAGPVGLITRRPVYRSTRSADAACWDRYARFAERTFNVEIPEISAEELEKLDDELVKFVLDIGQSGADTRIVEHQRTSYLDKPGTDTNELVPRHGHVTLYITVVRYHDDAIVFEPAHATRHPQWTARQASCRSDLEVVHRWRHPGHRRAPVSCQGFQVLRARPSTVSRTKRRQLPAEKDAEQVMET